MRALAYCGIVLVSCQGGAPKLAQRSGEPLTLDVSAPAAQVDASAQSSTSSGATSSGLITDQECIAGGGYVVTEETYAHLRRRPRDPNAPVHSFRVCRYPSPKNGKACRASAECEGGRCYCNGKLSGPEPAERNPSLRALDGTAAAGTCSDSALPSGFWFCLVEDGRVHLSGIIID